MVSTSFSRIDSAILDVIWCCFGILACNSANSVLVNPSRNLYTLANEANGGDTAARIGKNTGWTNSNETGNLQETVGFAEGHHFLAETTTKKTIHKCTIYTPQLHHTPNIMIYHGILQTPHFATFTQKKHPSLRNCCLRPHRHHSEACQFLLFHANSFSCWCRHHLPTVPPRPELVENDPQPARLRVQKGKLWNYLEAVYRDSAKPSEH